MEAQRFKFKPYAHQLDCLNRFGRREYYALLAEQGTGKTFIIINECADLWSSGDLDSVLILAPNGVHENWTRIELPKHMPDWCQWRAAPYFSGASKKEQGEIEGLYGEEVLGKLRLMTMNWEALSAKSGFEAAKRFCSVARRLMIVADESDNAKNPSAARTKSLMKLKPYSHYRRIMTGTPINNAPFDAFSQFGFLHESILITTSYYAFKAEYAEMMPEQHGIVQAIMGKKKPRIDPGAMKAMLENVVILREILRKNGRRELLEKLIAANDCLSDQEFEESAAEFQKLREMFDPNVKSEKKDRCLKLIGEIEFTIADHIARCSRAAFHPNRVPQIVERDKKTGLPKFKNLDKLHALIAPHSFRVLKKDCLDLPEKIYKSCVFEMTKAQRAAYDQCKKENRLVLEGKDVLPIAKLTAAMKLSQITSGYFLHPESKDPVRIEGENRKLSLLSERVQAIVDEGNKVIVWARFRIEIADIVASLKEVGIDCVEYHGGIDKDDRKKAIDAFELGDAKVFVANQQAGGTGLTLIAASYVIYYSNDWSLRNRLQSEDRAHRIGQTKNVTYLNIMARDSCDEGVVRALMNKEEVADAIIAGRVDF